MEAMSCEPSAISKKMHKNIIVCNILGRHLALNADG